MKVKLITTKRFTIAAENEAEQAILQEWNKGTFDIYGGEYESSKPNNGTGLARICVESIPRPEVKNTHSDAHILKWD